MKMKTVRLTAIMAFCFTICQIPAATLYMIAWESPHQLASLSPVPVEVTNFFMYPDIVLFLSIILFLFTVFFPLPNFLSQIIII